jgi:parallel beta-helix repeat protein
VVVLGVLAGGLAAFAPSVGASVSTPPGGALYVNTNGGVDSGTCRLSTNPCATISYALTEASPSATIHVAAGTYAEQLVITQAVSIVGAGASTIIEPDSLPVADTDTDSSEPQYAIVDIPSATDVNLKDLTINGTDAEGQFTGCGPDFVGVYYHDSSGSLTAVGVQQIRLPLADYGCQDGQGVYVASDANTTSNVTMTAVSVTNYDKNGITCDDAGTTCSVTRSTMTGIGSTDLIAQNGFQGYNAASVTLTHNTVTDNSYNGGGPGNSASGLLIYDVGTLTATNNVVSDNDVNVYLGSDGTGPAEGAWTFSSNTVRGATDNVAGGETQYGDGIQIDSTSNALTVSSNIVTGSAENGISLLGVIGATISGNTASANTDNGIYVGGPGPSLGTGSSGNTVNGNIAKNNGNDGILADTDATSNTFSSNTTGHNSAYDLEDLGASNIWTHNGCEPKFDSSPAGLCG